MTTVEKYSRDDYRIVSVKKLVRPYMDEIEEWEGLRTIIIDRMFPRFIYDRDGKIESLTGIECDVDVDVTGTTTIPKIIEGTVDVGDGVMPDRKVKWTARLSHFWSAKLQRNGKLTWTDFAEYEVKEAE